jgi:hypothetical protein
MVAELVAVCGEYLAADSIPTVLMGRPSQVFLHEGRCRMAPLP